ncbi:MAG: zinc-ribbon domain-containing protein, partial [Eubacteriales bacterium]
IGITVYNFKNATSKNRYSSFDITDDKEEPDPLNERFGKNSAENEKHSDGLKFCPYCGAKVENGHQFCGECGKKLY